MTKRSGSTSTRRRTAHATPEFQPRTVVPLAPPNRLATNPTVCIDVAEHGPYLDDAIDRAIRRKPGKLIFIGTIAEEAEARVRSHINDVDFLLPDSPAPAGALHVLVYKGFPKPATRAR